MADVPASIHETDSRIKHYEQRISTSPRSDHLRPVFIVVLAATQLQRHILSNQREDLDMAIVHFTESILLLPFSWLQHGSFILDSFFHLASALFMRSKVTKQPGDAIYAAKYLVHLRDQPHETLSISRHRVTELLVDALAFQVELEAGNVMQNIREIAILSRELFIIETSDIDTTRLIDFIWEVALSKIDLLGVPEQPLDELIECLRAAMKRRPDLPQARAAFAMSLVLRYFMTSVDDDYEEAVSILVEMTTSGNSQDKSVARLQGFATGLAAVLAMARSSAHWTPEYLEEAMYRTRTFLGSPSYAEFFSHIIINPEVVAKDRFRYFGSIEGVEEPSGSFVSLPVSAMPVSEAFDEMVSLGLVINDGDTMKIDEAIKKGRSIATSSPEARILDTFCDILSEAFHRTKKIEYLNESIRIRRQALESPTFPQALRLRTFPSLSRSLLARSHYFPGYRAQDIDEGLELLTQCVNNTHVRLPDRLRLVCLWADFSRSIRHPSVSSVYKTALSLMQDTPLFSPTLQLQHAILAMYDVAHSLPLDYASYQLDHHQLEEAIETLERGRALLWSEMRHLRVPTNQLLEAYPDLGRKFAAVNRDLEELTKSIPPSHKLSMDDAPADNLRAVDPFGRLLLTQRGLLKERDKLISQIQTLPGFDTFLASPSFDRLRSAASSGPIIIINLSIWRSDILVLLHHLPPSLIPTPDNFYSHANALKDKLLDSRRKSGLDSSHYEETLAYVLKELYKLVGKPVIDRLHQLQVPEQSRIWWCPTSVFCSLPLHAMGPIPSDDGEPRYFLDLYVCSYTPTLSALMNSHHHGSSSLSFDRPSVLLVAQPGKSLPTVGGEIEVVQALDAEVTSLISETATPATVIDGFHHHQFVHFACHGTLEAGKPFKTGFELHGDARLTLLEIVRAHLPTAEFAFLSACHTAAMTEGSVMDEGLHLAAAIQYCGFRSVVGTMWAMVDEDGQELAENFYRALFSNARRDQGIPYHERSAKALRVAVKKLRRKRWITLERWVNFVHYGA